MARITVNLDADLVIEVMLLSGIRNAQDAVEAIVRDYLVAHSRTGMVIGDPPVEGRPDLLRGPDPQQG